MGKRMGDITKEIPKCMVPVAGRPLIEWQTGALQDADIARIGVVRGYLGHKIRLPGIEYFENPDWAGTNMVASLGCAGNWLRAQTCVVSYSDIVYSGGAIRRLMEAEGDIVIGNNLEWRPLWEARFPNPLDDAETFRVDGNGFLVEIGKKPESMDEIEGQYMGLLKFTPAGWARVERHLSGMPGERRARIDVTALLQALVTAGEQVRTVPIRDFWFEIDSEADLDLGNRVVATRGLLAFS
jgi:choline kinase